MDNRTIIQYFEWYLPSDGTLWQKVAAEAAEMKRVGITSVWLPPAYKGAGGGCSVGYDVYDMYDLGEFDQKGSVRTKYGTRSEYLAAVKALHDAGLEVYADIVFNQMMGADETEKITAVDTAPTDREEEISGPHEIEAWTRFTFPGRHGTYSGHTWNKENFSGTDFDHATGSKGIYLFDGKKWNQETDSENVNFDYLMGVDLDTDEPDTYKALTDWGAWYFDTVRPDGLRLDAVKHMSFDFYRRWLLEMRRREGRDFFTVGEYWSGDLSKLLHYLDVVVDGKPEKIMVRIPKKTAQDAEAPEGEDAASQKAQDAAAPEGADNGASPLTDGASESGQAQAAEAAGRSDGAAESCASGGQTAEAPDAAQAGQGPASLDGQTAGGQDAARADSQDADAAKNAAWEEPQPLNEGTPMTLFDVPLHFQFLNAANDGHGFDMRGLFSGTLVEARPECAVTFVDNHDTEPGQALQSYIPEWFKPIAYSMILLRDTGTPCVFYGDYYGVEHANESSILDLRKLIAIRSRYAYGPQTDYFDDHSIVGFTRSGDEEHAGSGLAVLATSAEEGCKYMVVGSAFAGRKLYDALGRHNDPVQLDEKGGGTFHVHGGYVSVWLTEQAYREIRIHF